MKFWNSCSKSEATKDSFGCKTEFDGGKNQIYTTLVGERPGAKSGLFKDGISSPTEIVNICILRGEHWAFRRGKVDLTWIPNMETMRTGREKAEEGLGEEGRVIQ